MKNVNFEAFKSIFPKYEKENIKLGLSRIKKVLKKVNNPCKNIPAIQVVGTNGKGSITAFLESILFESKNNTGVTTSPHLLDISERIRVNKKNIGKNEFEKIFEEIEISCSCLNFDLSPFEKIICCALKFFDASKVDLLILEAGLGGRLDATSAHKLRPIIAIGNIGLDHQEYLGDTIEKITHEKIAVIQSQAVVISGNQNSKVKNIIQKKVNDVGAKIIWKESISNNYELGLKGNFQRQNAAVAIGVIEALNNLGFNIKEDEIHRGLKNTKWPGRLEIINFENKKILVDCAHNLSAAQALSEERTNWHNQEKGVNWILGVQKQKDISSMIRIISQKNDHILLVPVPNQKSWRLNEIIDIGEIKNCKITEFENLEFAIDYLFDLKQWPMCPPVLTGSIFLVAEFIKLAKKRDFNF